MARSPRPRHRCIRVRRQACGTLRCRTMRATRSLPAAARCCFANHLPDLPRGGCVAGSCAGCVTLIAQTHRTFLVCGTCAMTCDVRSALLQRKVFCGIDSTHARCYFSHRPQAVAGTARDEELTDHGAPGRTERHAPEWQHTEAGRTGHQAAPPRALIRSLQDRVAWGSFFGGLRPSR